MTTFSVILTCAEEWLQACQLCSHLPPDQKGLVFIGTIRREHYLGHQEPHNLLPAFASGVQQSGPPLCGHLIHLEIEASGLSANIPVRPHLGSPLHQHVYDVRVSSRAGDD